MAALWSILLVIVACLIGSFGPILMKKGTATLHFRDGLLRAMLGALTNWPLLGGLAVYGISSIIFIPALRGGELSILYPLVAIGYVFVSLWSVLILKERMNRAKWVGILLIIIGVSIVGLA
jgi:uncharacterized membrane protein